jgi:hypothetical protein
MRQAINHLTQLDQSVPLAVEGRRHQVRVIESAAHVLNPMSGVDRGRRFEFAGREVHHHIGEEEEEPVHSGLRDLLQHTSSPAGPAVRLRLVAPRQMRQHDKHGKPHGFDRSGVSQESFVRGGAHTQRVLGTAEPPHGLKVGCEVVSG